MTTDTRKIETALNKELADHQRECLEIIDLKYVKKNPVFSISIGLAILGIISGALAYYYTLEGRQNDRLIIIEQSQQSLEARILKNQDIIIQKLSGLELKPLR